MTDLIKNCIICVGGIALIGCFISINKFEQNHNLYKKNILLESRLSGLEDKNNQLVNQLDCVQNEITNMKNLLEINKNLLENQKILLEQISNLVVNSNLNSNSTNLSNGSDFGSDSTNSLNSGLNIKLEDIYSEDKNIQIEYSTKDIIEEPIDLSNVSNVTNSDDELVNDCYDSIPMNNIKKVTGIKGWFY